MFFDDILVIWNSLSRIYQRLYTMYASMPLPSLLKKDKLSKHAHIQKVQMSCQPSVQNHVVTTMVSSYIILRSIGDHQLISSMINESCKQYLWKQTVPWRNNECIYCTTTCILQGKNVKGTSLLHIIPSRFIISLVHMKYPAISNSESS